MPILFLLIATFFWGGTFTVVKVLVDASLCSYFLVGFRSIMTALIVLLLFHKTIRREFKVAIKMKMLLGFGVLNGLALILQTKGLEYTSAGNAAFITAFAVLIVPVIGKIHYGIKTSWLTIVAIFLSLIGIFLISFGFVSPLSLGLNSFNIGDFLVFICAIIYGYYIVFMSILSRKISASTLVFFAFFISGVMGLGYDLISHQHFDFVKMNLQLHFFMFLLVVLGGVVPYMLMAVGQKKVTAELAAIIYLFEPVFAIILSKIFLDEKFAINKIIGSSLILAALVFGVFGEKRNSTEEK